LWARMDGFTVIVVQLACDENETTDRPTDPSNKSEQLFTC
jgi:hypothetical protein